MFNVGAGEIAIILIAALLLLGPDKLPELARGLGKFMREFRRQTDEVRNVVEREFYRMDQDVMAEPEAPPRDAAAPVAPPALANALPPPTFPAFPTPDGVVASVPGPEPVDADPGPHPSAPPAAKS